MAYSDIYNGPPKLGDSSNTLLLKLWYRLQFILLALGGGSGEGVSGLPYGAVEQDITNVAAGPSVIVYKNAAGGVLKTRTFTYTNSGVSSTDVLTKTVDT